MWNYYQERQDKLEHLDHQLGLLRRGAVYGHLFGVLLIFFCVLLCR